MTSAFMAEFDTPESLLTAAAAVHREGYGLIDTFTPYPLPEVDELIESRTTRIRMVMLAAGLAAAVLTFALQWYSAVISYPLNSGGRPLNSWPVFLLVPFEVGILAAAVAGAVAFLWGCGLPRLHHPVFDVIGFERATQDRFFLLASHVREGDRPSLRGILHEVGARTVTELRT